MDTSEKDTVFKATNNNLKKGEKTFDELKLALQTLGINSQHKLLIAKKDKKLQIPNYYTISRIFHQKTGQNFDEFFDFQRSKTKPRKVEQLMESGTIEKIKQWCHSQNIKSQAEFSACKNRPKEIPTVATIITHYGEEYFTQVLGLVRYKATFEDRLLDDSFINSLRKWCIDNNITSINKYNKAIKPEGFPSAERVRNILGLDYFRQVIKIARPYFTFLTKEKARDVCIENGIYTSNSYSRFYQLYNKRHEIKLPSDIYRSYQTNWANFIQLTDTQIFIGNSMSNLELFTYKLLYDRMIDFEMEKTFANCRSKNPLPFDFYLISSDSRPVIIELDGEQHRITNKKNLYYSPSTEKHDEIKNQYCLDNGIELIRINQITQIEKVLVEKIGLDQYPKIRDLDWTTDFNSEEEVLDSKLSKSIKVKLLLLMAERGKSHLTNGEIISKVGIVKPTFYALKNELIRLELINRPNDYYFSDQEKENIVKLHQMGKSITVISKETGYKNRAYLIKILEERGYQYISPKPTPEEARELRVQIAILFDKSHGPTAIAKILDKTPGFISLAIKEIKMERGEIMPDKKVIEVANRIREGLSAGKTMKQLIDELGYSRQYLNKFLLWTKKYAHH